MDVDSRYGKLKWKQIDNFTRNTVVGKYNSIALVDVVWNHMSYDARFLRTHPQATYNLKNCPYLIPAFKIDVKLQLLSKKGFPLYGLDFNRDNSTIRNVLGQHFEYGSDVYRGTLQ